ncbi:putative DNA-binding domain-containing protein [Aliiglaciecola sp. CAU 1673]|uniref:HvfC family RiPP maturation protein n=1 Tax=Aliiglaciecola sp. CAU 1673 TaxID=3032595 RepID=UPI0023DA2AC8|nr:putative DNA-binding domain-containing protein [Aliiglaciecola sp. CAU 1673]MDF2179560.1 putative DNA-binding domain-containing protein [Aliiglaciecola sp. CAU 1673]
MSDLRATQLVFVEHLRDPLRNAAPKDIEDRRLAIYRELFFNNIMGFISSGFPVLKSLYSKEEWEALCREFFAEHACRSPYFVEISKEFVEYLSNEYRPKDHDPVFMAELAHYEWIELAVSIAKEADPQQFWQGQAYQKLAVSQLACAVSYQYPVHQISSTFKPEQPTGPYFFVVHRNNEDKVEFTQINQINAYLLNLIDQHGVIDEEVLLQSLVSELPQLPEDQVRKGAREAIENFLRKQVLVVE